MIHLFVIYSLNLTWYRIKEHDNNNNHNNNYDNNKEARARQATRGRHVHGGRAHLPHVAPQSRHSVQRLDRVATQWTLLAQPLWANQDDRGGGPLRRRCVAQRGAFSPRMRLDQWRRRTTDTGSGRHLPMHVVHRELRGVATRRRLRAARHAARRSEWATRVAMSRGHHHDRVADVNTRRNAHERLAATATTTRRHCATLARLAASQGQRLAASRVHAEQAGRQRPTRQVVAPQCRAAHRHRWCWWRCCCYCQRCCGRAKRWRMQALARHTQRSARRARRHLSVGRRRSAK